MTKKKDKDAIRKNYLDEPYSTENPSKEYIKYVNYTHSLILF